MMSGIIYIDYAEAIRIQTRDKLRNWGRKANLPIYKTIVALLDTSPGIRQAYVKAHWTRAQWGNVYADRLAKGDEDIWATRHVRWPIPYLENLVMRTSPWHWISQERHLLLEPISQLIQTKIPEVYLVDRDIY